jgi:hypothetical protein
MSYQLNKTDGTILTDLIDGQIDTTSTNLVLVGRNYTGYGEYFNENFIKLLENFSNTASPSNPLTGQTWWDNSDKRLKVYDGTQWKASGGPFVQTTQPQMVAGDLWIDSLNNQVYAYDGSDLILMGPSYTLTQGETGYRVESILDAQSRSRTVANLYVGGTLTAVVSALEFTPVYSQQIDGLVTAANPNGIIYQGFNIIDTANFKFRGIASSANALVTAGGIVRTADSFLPSTANGLTTGTLTISNSGGLTVGVSQNHVQKIVGPRYYLENQITDEDMSMRVKSSSFGSITVDAIYVDASTARVGIFNRTDAGDFRLPDYTLDVDGDLRVTGNLLIEGTTTSIDVATLRIEDKNIEIAKTAAGVTLTGINADNAGFILDTSDVGQKLWTWKQAQDAWTTNVNLDLSDNTKALKIGGENKLTNTSLVNIQKAPQLDEIGTLINLDVDNININGHTITAAPASPAVFAIVSNRGINITAAGDINVTDSQKITGVAKAVSARKAVELAVTESIGSTVATKEYVDEELATGPVVFSLDVTGMGADSTLEANVATVINSMYPAATLNTGKIAKIHTTSYAGATVTGINITVSESPDNTGVLTKNTVVVDQGGVSNAGQAIQDLDASNTASGSVVLTPTRKLMTYTSNGTAWTHISTTEPYSF